ncbi:hypothetical protein EV426DRAFT_592975 [Tirmania nivea]|nr:hypothetical protein EV426DRAFT_592975 [Tirmania nivea]
MVFFNFTLPFLFLFLNLLSRMAFSLSLLTGLLPGGSVWCFLCPFTYRVPNFEHFNYRYSRYTPPFFFSKLPRGVLAPHKDILDRISLDFKNQV